MAHGFLHAILLHRNLLSLALHKLVAAELGGEVVTGTGHDCDVSKYDAIAENYLEIIEAVILSEDQKNVDAAAGGALYGRRLLLRQDPGPRTKAAAVLICRARCTKPYYHITVYYAAPQPRLDIWTW